MSERCNRSDPRQRLRASEHALDEVRTHADPFTIGGVHRTWVVENRCRQRVKTEIVHQPGPTHIHDIGVREAELACRIRRQFGRCPRVPDAANRPQVREIRDRLQRSIELRLRQNALQRRLTVDQLNEVVLRGRIAEEIIFGKENITTGAGNDIQQATGLARRMVTEFGFSDKLGRLRYADNEEEVFLGHSVARQKHVSDATAKLIDEEVRRLIEEAEQNARHILTEHRDELEIISNGLLEFETLSGDEVHALLRGEDIHRDHGDGGAGADTPRRTSIPTGGKTRPKKGPGGAGSIDPEPQPGQ